MQKENNKTYDILLKNLRIVDGTGMPSFFGDIGIKGDTIVDVGKCSPGLADSVFDCLGLIAAPGFIDIHNHSDSSIFKEPYARNYTSQGVTTLVVGNCGISFAPVSRNNMTFAEKSLLEALGDDNQNISFKQYIEALDRKDIAVNIAALVGHGNIRGSVMGMEDKKPTPDELEAMRNAVKESMESGAFGMSTGLIYDPGIFTETEEIIELAKIVGEYGGVYASHMRNESDLMIDSVMEAITIGRKTGARVQISHHKASGKRNWGLVKTTLELMKQYRKQGVEVTCDVYPCTFSSTDLYSLFPSWIREKGKAYFVKQLRLKETKERLRQELIRPGKEWENIILDAGFSELIIADSEAAREYAGKSIKQIADTLNMDPYDVIFDIVAKDPAISVLAGGMSEEDMKYVMSHELSMIGSDGLVMKLYEGLPHPRSYRAFTKTLASYVRDEELLSLEKAVQKMSYYSAWKLGIKDRGLIKPGFKADVSIFDLWDVNFGSDFHDPHHYSKGMIHVLVNGKFTIQQGQFTDETSGCALRRG